MDKTIIITIHKTAWRAVAPALDALDKAGADYSVTATDAAGPVHAPERPEPKASSAFEAAIAEWLKR